MRAASKIVLFLLCLTFTACATQAGLGEKFDRSVKAYNRLLRWHELENAVMNYGDPEHLEENLKEAEAIKKRGVSITDYRILTSNYSADKQTGDAVTEFDYYILPSNRIKTASYRQEWIYQKKLNAWKLKTHLPLFE